MPQIVTKYRIVIASPGDVVEERELASKVINSINTTYGNTNNIVLETVIWETHSTPGIGRVQQKILDGFGKFDILVGIMWKRFGTPTGKADSGTEEEFNHALELYNQDNITDIMFYFKVSGGESITQSDDELKQLKKVIDFKKKVETLSLAKDFYTKEDFRDFLREHLERKIHDFHHRNLDSTFEQAPKQKLHSIPNFWNTTGDFLSKSFSKNYSSNFQIIPILKKTNQSEKTILEIYSRLIHSIDEKELLWIDDDKKDEFNLIYINTSVLYFLLQLGLDIEDTSIKSPLEYLDNIKTVAIDKRAKWFFDIQTNRITQNDCMKFIELLSQSQIKDDVPTKGAFLFSQASTNDSNWQTFHPGGYSFHACYIADILLHLPPNYEASIIKAKSILTGIASFLKKISDENNGYILDINQNSSLQLTTWYYALSERIGTPLLKDWEIKIVEIISKDETNILRRSFLIMNLSILLKENFQKMKQSTINSIYEYFDAYHEELSDYLFNNNTLPNRDLSVFGRALLYCNIAVGNDLKNVYKTIKL